MTLGHEGSKPMAPRITRCIEQIMFLDNQPIFLVKDVGFRHLIQCLPQMHHDLHHIWHTYGTIPHSGMQGKGQGTTGKDTGTICPFHFGHLD